MSTDAAEMLGRVPLFRGLSERELRRVAKGFRERVFAAGEAAALEGREGLGFFVVLDGVARVSIADEVVATLRPGDFFGEMSLIDREPRSATIVADTDLRCLAMTAWVFKPFVESHPSVAWNLLETLARRVREAEHRAGG